MDYLNEVDESNEVVETENSGVIDIKDNIGVYVHNFKQPFKYQGKTYKSMKFDFAKLTGNDMIKAEREMRDMGDVALDPIVSKNMQAIIAAKAAGVGSDMIYNMYLNDFSIITGKARNFLMT